MIERLLAGEPVLLIGSSMGGYLAALYAASHSEVQRLALLAPAFDFARRWSESLGADRVAAWRANGTMDIFHYGEGRTRSLHYGILEDAQRVPAYPDFRQPALIIHGRRDDVVPSSLSELFVSSHPNAVLEIVDSGHELHDVLDYMTGRVSTFLLDGECYPEH
jgi:pimeloyl-ACP methyl ester carboxylesterase